jgi:CubicO group peptidase (beta-lactamase class C family)
MTHPPMRRRNGRRAALGMLAGIALLAGATPAKASAGPVPVPVPGPVRVPTPTGVWAGFGAWLGQRATAGQFSGTALVVHDGRVLLDAGYGLADRASSVADTPQTRYCVASIGKLFTAIAVAQLVEQHRLSFTDPIGRYLTGFAPAVADGVTVGELLDMTSGLGDVVLGRPDPPATLAGMMQLIEAEPLQSQPGSTFLYSNDGYIVLGALIEAVTGESYQRYVTDHVLAPAGMTHTSLTPYTPADVPGMAHGYALVGTGATAPPVWQDVSDAGAGQSVRRCLLHRR